MDYSGTKCYNYDTKTTTQGHCTGKGNHKTGCSTRHLHVAVSDSAKFYWEWSCLENHFKSKCRGMVTKHGSSSYKIKEYSKAVESDDPEPGTFSESCCEAWTTHYQYLLQLQYESQQKAS